VTASELVAGSACFAVLLALLLPAIPHVTSVQVPLSWDFTFSDELGKQVSGFSLVGLALLGLAVSLRKRLGWLSRFRQSAVRSFHVATGAGTVLAYVVHTGMRLGENLDRALALAFLSSAFIGGVAALVPAMARRRPSWSRFKVWLERLHLYAVWPLPVLVVFHVLKVYFF
jgi:nitrite reductase (NADH) large subunit